MSKFASNTSVSTEASRAEIERTLTRYGADHFAYASSRTKATVMFEVNGRTVRFELHLPNPADVEFTHSNHLNPRERTPKAAYEAWEQACRQKWRALNLVIKAKLEAIESDITTFDDEFMAHLVLPSGDTVSEYLTPRLEAAYKSGKMPGFPMLAAPK